ncbi:hypothetical protein RI367_006764 [Sorochytrium milnesiophthora]
MPSEQDRGHRLGRILNGDMNTDEWNQLHPHNGNGKDHDDVPEDSSMHDVEAVMSDAGVEDGNCVECMDQPAELFCEQSDQTPSAAQHRKSRNRARHTTKPLHGEAKEEQQGVAVAEATPPQAPSSPASRASPAPEDPAALEPLPLIVSSKSNGDSDSTNGTEHGSNSNAFGNWITERAKFIPVRLTMAERKILRLLDAALKVSEYTDKIDIVAFTSRTKRIVAQIKEVCQILAGLVLAADYKIGQELFCDKDFQQNEEWFRNVFEIGRRHKIMNPEKMRSTYGKLIYMLQDSAVPEVCDMLQFSCIRPVKTVYRVLEEAGCLELLQDQYVAEATKEILSEGKSRRTVDQEIRRKEKAVEYLAQKYKRKTLSDEQIRQLLYSVGDNHNYLRFNRDPCDRMVRYLTQYFSAEKPEHPYSLGIQSGKEGARLTHNHGKQYTYVYQSLSLWREIAHEMFMLWCLAEEDLLAPNTYRLRDTGQGLNRVQPCPRIGRAMNGVLHRAQQKLGFWVGSSVIHLGDDNVPNALMFIDKYTQVARILNPVLSTLDSMDKLFNEDKSLAQYVDTTFGSVDDAKKTILSDFFRHAFDGSGADNFSSAGSCIDGRLTSAWNWCSQIEKKSYFPVFLLTGFIGFDGESFEV